MSNTEQFEVGQLTEADRDTMERTVDDLLLKLHATSNQKFTPSYPWVFVRQCSREQVRNGIWLPASDQNKTVLEGIVIATWQPCIRVEGRKVVEHVSDLQRGDHVLFNHWAGVPLTGHKDQYYRLVKERGFSTDTDGGILATLEYDALHTRPVEQLNKLISEHSAVKFPRLLANRINEMFLLMARDTPSVTISGR